MATTRFGVSLDEELLRKFDRLINGKGYPNRSEAIRDLIRDRLVSDQWEVGTEETAGTITLVFPRHEGTYRYSYGYPAPPSRRRHLDDAHPP